MPSSIRTYIRPLPALGLLATASISLTLALSRRPAASSKMSTSATAAKTWPVKPYTPRHSTFPYAAADFARQDPSPDRSFYSAPRFVTHIDDAAIGTLREYYDGVLPRSGKILDFCSSWISHYPASIEHAAAEGSLRVVGLGMNQAELDANDVLNGGRLLVDLNADPDVHRALQEAKAIGAEESEKLDASTNVVSTDYLTRPVEVLRSLREATKVGGSVHLTISNRCFPTKAIRRWLQVDEEERLLMVGDFLHFAGWAKIEIVELSDGKVQRGEQAEAPQGLQGIWAFMGMNSRDPLWVVRAVKE